MKTKTELTKDKIGRQSICYLYNYNSAIKFVLRATMVLYTVNSCVQGFRVYKDDWIPVVDEELDGVRE